ncbi:MAG: hypothetical protein MK214_18440 [Thalassotalea sp.]|nr:hypothetical protein [Thalassotalea sp.]
MKSSVLTRLLPLALIASFSVGAQKADSGFIRDFEHSVQFSIENIDEKTHRLIVTRQGRASFEVMNVFATRKARQICGNLGFSIKYLEGVELFDDKRAKPNYIFPSLKVDIRCP